MKKAYLILTIILFSLTSIGLAQAGTFLSTVTYKDYCPRESAYVRIYGMGGDPGFFSLCGLTNASGQCENSYYFKPNTMYKANATWPDGFISFGPTTAFVTDEYGNGNVVLYNSTLILDSDGNLVGDCHQPQWKNQGQSNNSIGNLQPNYLYAQVKSYQSDWTWLATNETGVWQNKTYIDMNDATDWTWSNFTWSNPSFVGTLGWKIYYNDTYDGFVNSTDVKTFEVYDMEPPTYSNIITNPTNPVYSPSAAYEFKITWTDNIAVDKVILEFDGVNYTDATKAGDVYSRTFSDLSAGTYTYKWYANDTRNNWNYTSTQTFTISKGSRTADVTFDKTSPITYETLLTVDCSVDNGSNDGTWKLYRNGIDVTASKGIPTRYGASTYNFNCSITGGANWNDSSKQESFTINAKNANVQVYPLTQTQAYPYTATQYCTDDSSLLNCNIYRNETVITNNTQYSPAVGVYVYKANISDTINYTNYQDSETLTVVPLPVVTIISPASPYHKTSVPLNFTVDRPTIWTGYSLDGNTTVTSGNTTLTGLTNGNHTMIVYAKDTSGNIGSSTTTFSYCYADINDNKAVDLPDLVILANAYDSKPGDAKWNPAADINDNKVVDLADLVLLANNYGKRC